MTKEELLKNIRDQVAPMVKELSGPMIAEAVEGAVAKHVATKDGGAWAKSIMEKAIADAAAANGGSARIVEHLVPIKEREKGAAFGRIIRAYAACKVDGVPFIEGVPRFLKGWGDDDLAKSVVEAQQKAMAAGAPGAGGFLIPDQFSGDVIELLRPAVVVRKLGAIVIPMPTGTLRIPKITGGTTAYYQGEGLNANPSQLATGQITMAFKKLLALVPLSNDLLRFSSPAADTIVRNDVVRAMAQRENQAFLRDSGMPTQSQPPGATGANLGATPRGLKYWAPPQNILAATAGAVTLQQATTDLGRMILQLMNANVPMSRPAWIFAPRTWHYLMTIQNSNGFFVFREELMQGRLWGWPFAITTQVPINLTDRGGTTESEITLVDLDDVVIGESTSLIVDASMEAAYYDGTSVQAAFSQDQTVIRAIQEHDLAVRRDVCVTVMNGVTWGA